MFYFLFRGRYMTDAACCLLLVNTTCTKTERGDLSTQFINHEQREQTTVDISNIACTALTSCLLATSCLHYNQNDTNIQTRSFAVWTMEQSNVYKSGHTVSIFSGSITSELWDIQYEFSSSLKHRIPVVVQQWPQISLWCVKLSNQVLRVFFETD